MTDSSDNSDTEPSPGQDAMDRALVLFAFAVALGVTGNPQAQIRQCGPCVAPEPVVPLDREALAIEFEPEDAPAGLVRQLGADVHLADFRPAKARFQLDVTDFTVRLQHHVVPAAVDLTLEHFNIAPAVSPHDGEQLAEEQVPERLLAQT